MPNTLQSQISVSLTVAFLCLVGFSEIQGQEVSLSPENVPLETPAPVEQSLTFDLPAAIANLSDVVTAEQSDLDDKVEDLMASNPTQDEVATWMEENQSSLDAQGQHKAQLSAYLSFRPMDYVGGVSIPPNASAATSEHAVLNAELYNRFSEIHNELVEKNTDVVTPESMAELQNEANDSFQEEYAVAISRKNELAKKIAEELAHQWVEPPTLNIPSDATPRLKAYLTLKYQLTFEEVALHNQNRSGTFQQGQAALEAWREENSQRFQQLSDLAHQLNSSS